MSIKAQLEAVKQGQKQLPEEQLPRFGFTPEMARTALRKYAHIVKDQGKDTFYHALIKRDPLVSEETITLLLDNSVQVEYIKPLLVAFSEFLKDVVFVKSISIFLLLIKTIQYLKKDITILILLMFFYLHI